VPILGKVLEQAFGDLIMSRKQAFQWHSQFKTGLTSADNDKHTGRPTSCTTPETVARSKELVHQDRRWTIHNVAERVGISYGTCQKVLMKEGGIKNIPGWCHHLYSICGSVKHWQMEGLPCVVSQCDKLHVGGWMWAVHQPEYFG
jgi:hypothetical protein